MSELMKMPRFLGASLRIDVTVPSLLPKNPFFLFKSGFSHYTPLQKELNTTMGLG